MLEPKYQSSSPKSVFGLSNTNLKTIDRPNLYKLIYNAAETELASITQPETCSCCYHLKKNLLDSLRALEIRNHTPVEQKFLGEVIPYKSRFNMLTTHTSSLLWDHLRATSLCSIALNDNAIIELFHEKLDSNLFQELINDVFISVLGFDADKVLNSLIAISKRKSEKKISLHQFLLPDAVFAKELPLETSCKTVIKYLKFLEKNPDTSKQMMHIFSAIGVFEFKQCDDIGECGHTHYQLKSTDKFYKADIEIQLLLLKIAIDNNFLSYVIDSEFDPDISSLARHLSQLTKSNKLYYRDAWSLIKCLDSLLPIISMARITESFRDGSYLEFPDIINQKCNIKGIAKHNHIHCKNSVALIELAAATIIKEGLNWLYPSDSEPKAQITFLNNLYGPIAKEAKLLAAALIER